MLLIMCNEWLGIGRLYPGGHTYQSTKEELVCFGYDGQLMDACRIIKQYETNYMRFYSNMALTLTLLSVSEISSNQGYDVDTLQALGVTWISQAWADNVGK